MTTSCDDKQSKFKSRRITYFRLTLLKHALLFHALTISLDR
jgi:hypothetical protein